MSLWTVRLSKISRRASITSQNILSIGDGFQVGWIHTLSVATQVIYRWVINVIWNGTSKYLIRKSMCKFRLCPSIFSLEIQLAVAGGLT